MKSKSFVFWFILVVLAAPLHAITIIWNEPNDITENSFMARYTTDAMAQVTLYCGPSESELERSFTTYERRTEHYIPALGLKPGTTYYYRAVAVGADGRIHSEIHQVTTKGPPPIIISKLTTQSLPDKIIVSFLTNVPSRTTVWLTLTAGHPALPGSGQKLIYREETYRSEHTAAFAVVAAPLTEYAYRIEAQEERGFKTTVEGVARVPEPNLARGMRVFGTFDQPVIHKNADQLSDWPGRITDGKFNLSQGLAQSGSVKEQDQYAIIDLGNIYRLRRLITFWHDAAYPQYYSVLVSRDGETWTAAAERLKPKSGLNRRAQSNERMRVHTAALNNQPARLVKILIPRDTKLVTKSKGTDYVQLFEVEVYGDVTE